jgi:hypothetical protein
MRHDCFVAHIRCEIIGVDSTIAPSAGAPVLVGERGIPLEATPEHVGELSHEVLHAATYLHSIPFGALRAAVRGRPVLSLLGPVVDAAEAFAARVGEYHRAVARLETERETAVDA